MTGNVINWLEKLFDKLLAFLVMFHVIADYNLVLIKTTGSICQVS